METKKVFDFTSMKMFLCKLQTSSLLVNSQKILHSWEIFSNIYMILVLGVYNSYFPSVYLHLNGMIFLSSQGYTFLFLGCPCSVSVNLVIHWVPYVGLGLGTVHHEDATIYLQDFGYSHMGEYTVISGTMHSVF